MGYIVTLCRIYVSEQKDRVSKHLNQMFYMACAFMYFLYLCLSGLAELH